MTANRQEDAGPGPAAPAIKPLAVRCPRYPTRMSFEEVQNWLDGLTLPLAIRGIVVELIGKRTRTPRWEWHKLDREVRRFAKAFAGKTEV